MEKPAADSDIEALDDGEEPIKERPKNAFVQDEADEGTLN